MDADGPRGPTGPSATGERLGWAEAPSWLRGEVEGRLGGRVVEAVTQPTGFSPGLAARLRLADGRRAFVKAVGPEPNPDSPGAHRAEARAMAVLPRSAPAPRLLWSLEQRGWVALAFEDVDGAHPTLPWRPGELRRVLAMLTDMARALTPAPAGMPRIADRLQDSFMGWRRLAAAHAAGTDEPTWRPAGRGPPRARPCSTPTCGPTTCCSPRPGWWPSTGPGCASAPPGSTCSCCCPA
jgi:hypothetical protein